LLVTSHLRIAVPPQRSMMPWAARLLADHASDAAWTFVDTVPGAMRLR